MNAAANANDQARFATMEAMDKQRAFSWVAGRNKGDVQKGVYIQYSQQFFQTYEMKKAK